MASVSGRDRILENPFYVLGLRPECTRIEIEREGQKLLAMLELKLTASLHYQTPLGPAERTPEKVRQAMAELRDPHRRLEHEIWAMLDPTPLNGASAAPVASSAWPEARRKLGWGRP